MTNYTRLFLLGLLCAAHLHAAETLYGVGLTLNNKILFQIGLHTRLNDVTTIRTRIHFNGYLKPVAAGAALLHAERTWTAWQAVAGLGVDVIPHRTRSRMTWTPYLHGLAGVNYHPHDTLHYGIEYAAGYFPTLRRLVPLGMTMWHFNSLK